MIFYYNSYGERAVLMGDRPSTIVYDFSSWINGIEINNKIDPSAIQAHGIYVGF